MKRMQRPSTAAFSRIADIHDGPFLMKVAASPKVVGEFGKLSPEVRRSEAKLRTI